MAQSGLDATTGSSRALSALQNNLQAGRSTATAQGLGDAFGTFASLFKRSQEAAAARRRGAARAHGMCLDQHGYVFVTGNGSITGADAPG